MKSMKDIESRRPTESRSHQQYEPRKLKSGNDNVPKGKTKTFTKNIRQLDNSSVLEAKREEVPISTKRVGFSKKTKVDKKQQNINTGVNKPPYQRNVSNENQIKKMPSKIVYKRKFSKYNDDVQQKLKAKFKSSFKSSGKFDSDSTKYKAYVDKSQNKRNKSLLKNSMCSLNVRKELENKSQNKRDKSLLKHSMCSMNFRKELENKKRTVVCSELPGKGMYNHRFAYDEALKLQQKGADVDVLYKVKNNTDSIYVINGEFLLTKNLPSNNFDKLNSFDELNNSDKSNNFDKSKKNQVESLKRPQKQKQTDGASKKEEVTDSEKLTEEEASWLNELAKMHEEKKKKKSELAKLALKQKEEAEREKREKYEEFMRKQKMRELEKNRRSEQLRKFPMEKQQRVNKLKKGSKESLRDHGNDENTENKDDCNLERLQFQKNLASIYKTNMNNRNKINCKLDINPANAFDGVEIITDCNVINDIRQWVLRNDGTCGAMSWLKIVAGRIDCLGERVNQCYTNKWMRIAIDKVVNIMTGEKMSPECSEPDLCCQISECNKNTKVSNSFVMETRRTTNCYGQKPLAGVRKSLKFTGCPGRGNLYRVTKADDGSYFQVFNVDDAPGCRRRLGDRTN